MRRILLAIILFVVLISCVLWKFFFSPTYEAEAVLLANPRKAPTSVESEREDIKLQISYIRNHIELMLSDPILRKVVTDLKLQESLSSGGLFGSNDEEQAIDDNERKTREAVELLKKKISIENPPFTNLIKVKVKFKTPICADIANHLAENYIQKSIGLLHGETDRIIVYLDDEVDKAHKQLKQSEEDLRKFKADNGIIDLPEEIKTYLQMIPEEFKVRYQYAQANQLRILEMKNEVNLQKKNSLYQLMQYIQANQLKALEVTNALNLETNRALFEKMQAATNKLLESEAELIHLRELYTDKSPQVKYMLQNIQDIQNKITKISADLERQSKFSKIEIDKETADFKKKLEEISLKAQEQDDDSYKQIEEEAKKFKENSIDYQINQKYLERFKGLSDKEMMLTRMEREVKVNEIAYTFLVQEQKKAYLIRAKQTTENIELISPALRPYKPKGRMRDLFMGFFISLMLTGGFLYVTNKRQA